MTLSAADFPEFYAALDASELKPRGLNPGPFPWQTRLANRACAGDWPRVIALPTAAGKTAVMDVALFALACGAPGAARRLFFVVDRRIVVDEAGERALRIAKALRATLQNRHASAVLYAVARKLADLGGEDEPLVVATLRGGTVRDDAWARSPAQPAVCCSTVDQVGSRLLFRGYGLGEGAWPMHAGLVAHDALVIVDEAHCAVPFVQTLSAIADRYGKWQKVSLPGGLRVVQMSATPGDVEKFEAGPADYADETLARRFTHPKLARLIPVGKPAGSQDADDAEPVGGTAAKTAKERKREEAFRNALAKHAAVQARRLSRGPDDGPRVVGVILNRVATARAVFDELNKDPDAKAILLTGRVRAWDRDKILSDHKAAFAAGRTGGPAQPFFVVATQCIEVGANLDFDALVTECASLDALRQRFGRLNRLGDRPEAEAVILAREDQIKISGDEAAAPDAIYGHSLAATWRWLHALPAPVAGEIEAPEPDLFDVPAAPPVSRRQAARESEVPTVDLSVAALAARLPTGEALRVLCAPSPSAPVLLPAHLDCLVQTFPEPAPSPEVGLFLHGPRSGPADVNIVWRGDFDQTPPETWADLAALCPPASAEMLPVPFAAARRWLAEEPVPSVGDVEGEAVPDEDPFPRKAPEPRAALRWLGRKGTALLSPTNRLRPGDTIVVPMDYRGLDEHGWNPEQNQPPVRPIRDLGDALSLLGRGRAVLRLDPLVVDPWLPAAEATEGESEPTPTSARAVFVKLRAAVAAEAEERDPEIIRAALIELRHAPGIPRWMRVTAGILAANGRRKIITVRVGYDQTVSTALVLPHKLPRKRLVLLFGEAYRESDFSTADIDSSQTREVFLSEHQAGVTAKTRRFAAGCGLPSSLVETLTLAAAWHDVGKADPRFQTMLFKGNAGAARLAMKEGRPLAKSSLERRNRRARRLARKLAGYPSEGRHELQSLALLAPGGLPAFPLPADVDADLFLHLVASHHGCCRPFAPVVTDPSPVEVPFSQEGIALHARSDHGLAALGSGVAERFWRLTRRYGWFGLAWLETLLRLADHRQSEAEQLRD